MKSHRIALAVAALVAVVAAVPLRAQSARERLQDRCLQGGAGAAACLEGAIAVEAVTGGGGLALAGGNEFPGAVSTLGRRFGTTPRVAAGLRLGLVDVGYPDATPGGSSPRDASSWIPSLQAALAVGVFDGFRPRPTVGGVLSVDLMATAGWAFFSEGGGFDGAVGAFGYGVRVGLIRESFTLPGITLSAVRRHGGGLNRGSVAAGEPGAVALDGVSVTSLRATIGRELAALGIQAGLGWDRAASDGSFIAPAPGAPTPIGFDDFDATRMLFFGGVSATWLVTQFHGELFYAAGYEARAVADPAPVTSYDPTAGSLGATLTFRVLF